MKYAKISDLNDDTYYIIVSYENVNLWTKVIFATKPAIRNYHIGEQSERMSTYLSYDGEYNRIQHLTKADAFLEMI